jgi:hypothetical protein
MARDAEQACSTHQCLGVGGAVVEQGGDDLQVPILACDEQGRGAIILYRRSNGFIKDGVLCASFIQSRSGGEEARDPVLQTHAHCHRSWGTDAGHQPWLGMQSKLAVHTSAWAGEAPRSSRMATTSKCPFWHAMSRGVAPSLCKEAITKQSRAECSALHSYKVGVAVKRPEIQCYRHMRTVTAAGAQMLDISHG